MTEPTVHLIDIATLAQRLDVTIRHIRRLVQERRIPYVKVGRLIRFDAVEIDEWLNDARRPHIAG